MTNKKALEIVGDLRPCDVIETSSRLALQKAYKALKHRIAIPVESVAQTFGLCPICGHVVWRSDKFCCECGQALDWSEVES